MSKKLIFCRKYFLQNIIFLLMVKSKKKREKYASSSTLFTLFGLFTMSKKLTCRKKLPFHCAHTKLFTLNFIFHWISWFKYSILFTTFGVIKSTLNSIFYHCKWTKIWRFHLLFVFAAILQIIFHMIHISTLNITLRKGCKKKNNPHK